jgi:hypothetical protein
MRKSSYDDMEIADGDMASIKYCRVAFGKNVEKKRQCVYGALKKYCDLDTI